MPGISFRFLFFFSILAFGLAVGAQQGALTALKEWSANPFRSQLANYEAIRDLSLGGKGMDGFEAKQGISVPDEADPDWGPARDPATGEVRWVKIRALSENPSTEIDVVGDFNAWGENLSASDKMEPTTPPYVEAKVRLRHGMQYRLALREADGSLHEVLDPAADTVTAEGYLNSVFWDRGRPDAYKMTAPPVDLRGKAIVFAESELGTLVAKFRTATGQVGPAQTQDTYRFVAESGIIDRLADMGYNAVELLPFTTTVDGNDWRFRYLDYGIFGPDSRYGTPDDFARMVDAFNRKGLGVIMDAVVGHFPAAGNRGPRALGPVGLLNWLSPDGEAFFGEVRTEWSTYRYRFEDPYVRRMLADSILGFFKNYRLSGVRFDNVDGMEFYAPGGGMQFLEDFTRELRGYRPDALVIGESFSANDRLSRNLPDHGVGMTVRNDGHLFDFFQANLTASSSKIDLERLRRTIREGWGAGDAPRVGYLTDHDEAANKRGGATGAYPAQMMATSGASDWDVERRTKLYGSVPLLTHSWTMDLPQMRFLQRRSFNDNPQVDWDLAESEEGHATQSYFTALSRLVTGSDAFAFQNFDPDVESYTDYTRKVIVFRRENFASGQLFYIVMSFSDAPISSFDVGVETDKDFSIALDSDRLEFDGEGLLEHASPTGKLVNAVTSAQAKPHSVVLPVLPGYGVVVLEGHR